MVAVGTGGKELPALYRKVGATKMGAAEVVSNVAAPEAIAVAIFSRLTGTRTRVSAGAAVES